MIWIVSASKGIVDNYLEMNSRMRFIADVTGEKVSPWKPYVNNNRPRSPYCQIETNDGFDGVFITAHLREVCMLCRIPELCNHEFIIANTCIMQKNNAGNLLRYAKASNSDIRLYLAKQKLVIHPYEPSFLYVAFLDNFGQFGFRSTLSERLLFKNRGMGLHKAIDLSYNEISTNCDYR